eukprot:3509783-Rhodomonas_salina.1
MGVFLELWCCYTYCGIHASMRVASYRGVIPGIERTGSSSSGEGGRILRNCYAMPGTAIAHAALLCGAWSLERTRVACTLRNQIQETAFLVQTVLKMRFLVYDFAVFVVPGIDIVDAATSEERKETKRRCVSAYHSWYCPASWYKPVAFSQKSSSSSHHHHHHHHQKSSQRKPASCSGDCRNKGGKQRRRLSYAASHATDSLFSFCLSLAPFPPSRSLPSQASCLQPLLTGRKHTVHRNVPGPTQPFCTATKHAVVSDASAGTANVPADAIIWAERRSRTNSVSSQTKPRSRTNSVSTPSKGEFIDPLGFKRGVPSGTNSPTRLRRKQNTRNRAAGPESANKRWLLAFGFSVCCCVARLLRHAKQNASLVLLS